VLQLSNGMTSNGKKRMDYTYLLNKFINSAFVNIVVVVLLLVGPLVDPDYQT